MTISTYIAIGDYIAIGAIILGIFGSIYQLVFYGWYYYQRYLDKKEKP